MGGIFQAKAVTSAMEKARQGIQGLGRMAFSQCTEIINPATNRGLPPNLVAEDPSISLIFKGTDLNIAALTAELGFLASPVNHVQTAEMGNQSLNSLALISARYTHTANEVLSQLMAAHLIAVCQALDLRAMHRQFLELYQPQLSELVANWYGATEKLNVSTDSVNPSPSLLSNLSIPSDPLSNFSDLPNPPVDCLRDASNQGALDELTELLWSQLKKSFDMTVHMDARERFTEIAKSLRTVLLDHSSFNTATEFVPRLEGFTDALSFSLNGAWCSHRDAYLVHGDASSMLGRLEERRRRSTSSCVIR